jgi:hypothetical protein
MIVPDYKSGYISARNWFNNSLNLLGENMKTRFYVGVGVLLAAFAIVGFADEATDTYSKLMKPAAAANGTLTKSMDGDLAAVATNAAAVQTAFQGIEAFWAKRGAADAQGFAKNIQMAAKEVEDAAKAGNKDAAMAADKKIGANCGGCHMAHRDKAADGSFMIKQ